MAAEILKGAGSFGRRHRPDAETPAGSAWISTVFSNLNSGIQRGGGSCVAWGATEVTAIPVLLLDALHFTKDIPRELDSALKRHPNLILNYGAHLGFHEKMLQVLLASLHEAGGDPLGITGERLY